MIIYDVVWCLLHERGKGLNNDFTLFDQECIGAQLDIHALIGRVPDNVGDLS